MLVTCDFKAVFYSVEILKDAYIVFVSKYFSVLCKTYRFLYKVQCFCESSQRMRMYAKSGWGQIHPDKQLGHFTIKHSIHMASCLYTLFIEFHEYPKEIGI